MVVLADEVLESFFETDLSESFKLSPVADLELPAVQAGFLGDIWSSIATDSNKKIFNMFTDEIGKTIGKHQVRSNALLSSDLTAVLVGCPQAIDWQVHQTRGAKSSRVLTYSNYTEIPFESQPYWNAKYYNIGPLIFLDVVRGYNP